MCPGDSFCRCHLEPEPSGTIVVEREGLRKLEAEILRLRTTEAAAAHALDTIRQLLGLDLVPGEHPSVTRQRIEATLRTVQAERDAYREALTPSQSTERAFLIEHDFEWIEESDDGRGYSTRSVPWTTIMEIMEAIRKRAEATTATPANPQVGKEGQ